MEPDQIIFNREANDFIFDLTGFFTDFLNQLIKFIRNFWHSPDWSFVVYK